MRGRGGTSRVLTPMTPNAASGVLVEHPSVANKTKRLIDVVGALIGLLFTTLLTVPIAIAIKVDSPGPVFYRQVRCGAFGKQFVMWKFRSMVADAEPVRNLTERNPGFARKAANDARITKVGRLLRATSLDEAPQFLNVLRGDMSLVGTRPPRPSEVALYDNRAWQRLQVKTGLTGEWQVSGRSEITDFDQVLELDLRYQQEWSVRRDLSLLARTVPSVLRRRGAY